MKKRKVKVTHLGFNWSERAFDDKKRAMIKRTMEYILQECEKRDGRSLEQILNDLTRDVADWPEEDRKAAMEGLIWKAYPVKGKVIQ